MEDIRPWYINKALKSVGSLMETMRHLTEFEVHRCLELESQSLRRASVMDRLLSRAIKLHAASYAVSLREKYNALDND